MEEPLFHNPLIQTRMLTSDNLWAILTRAGFTNLDDLQEESGWKSGSDMEEFST